MTNARHNEVTYKLNKMFKAKDEKGKDSLVTSLKSWLKLNRNSQDAGKMSAIRFFLEELGVYC